MCITMLTMRLLNSKIFVTYKICELILNVMCFLKHEKIILFWYSKKLVNSQVNYLVDGFVIHSKIGSYHTYIENVYSYQTIYWCIYLSLIMAYYFNITKLLGLTIPNTARTHIRVFITLRFKILISRLDGITTSAKLRKDGKLNWMSERNKRYPLT